MGNKHPAFQNVTLGPGDELRVWRSAHRITQRELAGEVGVDNTVISMWENGIRVPAQEQREFLLRRCGIAPERWGQHPARAEHQEVSHVS